MAPVPASTRHLALFISWLLAKGRVQARYFGQYLAAVRALHVSCCLPAPACDVVVQRLLLAARNSQEGSVREELRRPLLVYHVHRACLMALHCRDAHVIRAVVLLVVSFLFFLRGASAARLRVCDLSWSGQVLKVALKGLKTSQQQADVVYRKLSLPRAEEVWRLLELFEELQLDDEDRVCASPLLTVVREVLVRLDMPAAEVRLFGGHSVRVGGACAARALGASLDVVCTHGTWSLTSTAVFRYLFQPVGASWATFAYFGAVFKITTASGHLTFFWRLNRSSTDSTTSISGQMTARNVQFDGPNRSFGKKRSWPGGQYD